MDDLNKAALEAAMTKAAEDPIRSEQLRAQLAAGRTWEDVAADASYFCQTRALRLHPWEEPPCVADEDDPEDRSQPARTLLLRMLAAGISRYDPDPMVALEAAIAASGE
jgi:hypothetical protein